MSNPLEESHPPIPWLAGSQIRLVDWRIDLFHDGNTVSIDRHDLINAPKFQWSLEEQTDPYPAVEITGTAEIRFAPDAAAAHWLAVASHSGAGAIAVSILSIDSDTETELWQGYVSGVYTTSGEVRVAMRSTFPGADGALCRRAVSLSEFPNLPPDLFLPQVFGRATFAAPPLFTTDRGTMRDDLAIDDGEIVLQAPVSWASPGRIQIQDEVLIYGAITDDGHRLAQLTREAPRFHERGADVLSLPMLDPLDWCLADHEAGLVSARAGSGDGTLLVDNTVSARTISGRAVRVLRRQRLPLQIGTSRYTNHRDTPRNRRYWRILPASNAYDPMDAFTESSPDPGAYIDGRFPTLAAAFNLPLETNAGRFDALDTLALSFEFSESVGWGPATRLFVRVYRGVREVSRYVGRQGNRQVVQLSGEAILPVERGIVTTERLRLAFERLETSGTWTDPEAAMDGRHDLFANGSGTLALGLASVRPETARAIVRVRFLARVRNPTGAEAVYTLSINVPEEMSRSKGFSVAAGETRAIALEVDLPSNVSASDLLGDATQFRFVASHDVDVAEVWLELDAQARASAFPASASSIPIQAAGTFPVLYHRVEMDVTELLTDENPWETLADEVEPLTVLIQVQFAPDIPQWAIALRDVHWKLGVRAATSVRPTDRIYVEVNGRGTRLDGTANPAVVVHAMLSEIASIPEAELDRASFDAAAVVADERGVSFAAAFHDDTAFGPLLARALGEAASILSRTNGSWKLSAATLSPGRVELAEFPREAIVTGSAEEGIVTRIGDSAPPVLLSDTGASVYRPRGPLRGRPITLRWLVSGGESLARWIASRRARQDSTVRVAVHPSWTNLSLGAPISIAPHFDSAKLFNGVVSGVDLDGGSLHLKLGNAAPVRRLFASGASIILRNELAGETVFIVAGRPVAVLSDTGDLSIRGIVRELALEPEVVLTVFIFETEQNRLRCDFQGVDGTASFAIDSAGNLLTTVPIAEEQTFSDAAPNGAGEMRTLHTVVGGEATGIAALRMNLAQIEIRGRLLSNQILD